MTIGEAERDDAAGVSLPASNTNPLQDSNDAFVHLCSAIHKFLFQQTQILRSPELSIESSCVENIEEIGDILHMYKFSSSLSGHRSNIPVSVCDFHLRWVRILSRDSVDIDHGAMSSDSVLNEAKKSLHIYQTYMVYSTILSGLRYDYSVLDSHLQTAAYNADIRGVQQLLDQGHNPDAKNSFGGTALHAAVLSGATDVVRAIVDAGADIDATDSLKQSPLMLATVANDVEIAKYLLERGASPSIPNVNQQTPLHVATCQKNVTMMRELMKRGADVTLRDCFQLDPVKLGEYKLMVVEAISSDERRLYL